MDKPNLDLSCLAVISFIIDVHLNFLRTICNFVFFFTSLLKLNTMVDYFISVVHAGLRSLYLLISESMSELEYLQVG